MQIAGDAGRPITVEAGELALRIVEMVRAEPEKSRPNLIDKLRQVVPDLDRNDALNQIQSKLERAFTADRSLAARIFEMQDWPWPFRLVLRQELDEIAARRAYPYPRIPPQQDGGDVYDLAGDFKLFGLALSGGGIRSATFNLGVLQRMGEHCLLQQVDYLSTVSGGGYIGTWLTSWMHRVQRSQTVIDSLSPAENPDPNGEAGRPIRFLRQFSNYLTPRLGLFSSDTWAMAAVYARNVTLNLAILISGFAALLLVPRLLGHIWTQDPQANIHWPLILGFLLITFAVYSVADSVRLATAREAPPEQASRSSFYGPFGVQIWCCAPLLLGSYATSWWVWQHLDKFRANAGLDVIPACGAAALSVLLLGTSHIQLRFEERVEENKVKNTLLDTIVVVLVPLGVGITTYALFRAYVGILNYFEGLSPYGFWNALVFAPPLFLMILSIAAIVHVGLLGIDLLDSGREWLSRFRGLTNIYTTFWLGLFVASIYGGLLFAKFALWVRLTLAAAWVGTTITSFLAGGSRKTGDGKDAQPIVSPLEIVAKIGPPVFAVGFVWAIAVGVHLLLALNVPRSGCDGFLPCTEKNYWVVLAPPAYFGSNLLLPGMLAIVCAAIALVLAWRVDINEFSMHHFYKNRLVRCYLGATNNNRKPNAFTGFDQKDDIHLAEFRPSRNGGPYQIINTTLNLSAGKNLAWQERKAASFFFSPLFSGYDYNLASPEASMRDDSDARRRTRGPLRSCAFRRTERYAFKGGVHIGTAMSISGAAADPNQGYNTSPAVAFLMTLFDVRLGWWLGNPRIDKKSKLRSPVFGLAALISELMGTTDDTTNFVNLSDGGHFDNLGLYELVRRHCRYIIVSDAEQDSSYHLGGLGMAIRKCRIDFGAEIEIDAAQIVPLSPGQRSRSHGAVGRIRYADGTKGVLVYIKSSLTGDEPEDLLEYAAAHPKFPHETTADQWFTESQFESYRKLGYHAADKTLTPAQVFLEEESRSVASHPEEKNAPHVFDALVKYWFPLNPGLAPAATKHTATLIELMTRIGTTPGLQQLGGKLFKKAESGSAAKDPVAEFYFCMSLIQLVEDIYFDFGLDQVERRTDPRIEGWMNLFQGWKRASRVDEVWSTQANTFRKDFQDFWKSL